MKKIILVALIAFLASWFWSGYPIALAGFAGNGDVNADNALDLSDPVYLLSFLFQGGPAPELCAPGAGAGAVAGGGAGAVASPLPGTSPEFCYDAFVIAPCVAGLDSPGGATCGGDDGFYAAGCSDVDRFDDHLDGTVTDTCTGLMWQKETNGDFMDLHSWCFALRYCETLVFTEAGTFTDDDNLGGDTPKFADWRLPNIRELHSIYEFLDNGAKAYNPPFDPSLDVPYWSSTHHQGGFNLVFTVRGSNGDIMTSLKTGGVTRAVRTVLPTDGGGAAGAGRGQGGVTVLGNGDVNADNSLDLSDAVYLLSFLFQGGPAPESCISPEVCNNSLDDDLDGDTDCDDSDCTTDASCVESMCDNGTDDDLDGDTDCDDSDCAFAANCLGDPSLLPDTGQRLCYDEDGNESDCKNSDCPGQDGFYSTGCPRTGEIRFDDNGDGTVTDNCTGLMWQQDTADVDGGGLDTSSESGDRPGWCEALDYCEDTLDGFAGHDDWRLPNVHELQSIVDHSQVNPAIAPIFTGVEAARDVGYWTSTTQQSFLAWHFLSRVGRFETRAPTGQKGDDETVQPPNSKVHGPNFVRAVRTFSP